MSAGSLPSKLCNVWIWTDPPEKAPWGCWAYHSDNELCFITICAQLAEETGIEYWNDSGKQCQYMFGWCNVERFQLPKSGRFEYYVRSLVKWQEDFEWGCMFTVPNPLDFAYHIHIVLWNGGSASVVWHIAITGYAVMALLLLLAAAGDGKVGVTCINSLLGCQEPRCPCLIDIRRLSQTQWYLPRLYYEL